MSYIGNQPTIQAFVTDTFSGTGSATVFTMSVAPATASSALVAISGVLQDPSAYTVVGTTLTFTGAPPAGTGNISVRYLGIPAITQAVANRFPFFKSTGASSDISLISNTLLPFYLANGSSSNIPLTVV
jgi:hypothetical protein